MHTYNASVSEAVQDLSEFIRLKQPLKLATILTTGRQENCVNVRLSNVKA